jgi:hypothetical protein
MPKWEKGETPKGANPFEKGKSGNPNGAPKGKRVSTIMKEMLSMKITEFFPSYATEIKGLTINQALSLELMKIAFGEEKKDGDRMTAVKEILDRIEGKAIQKNVINDPKDIKGITFNETE